MAISFAPHIGAEVNLRCTNAGKEGPVHGSSESVRMAFLAVPGAVADALHVRTSGLRVHDLRDLSLGT
jgi:hypothetical protein